MLRMEESIRDGHWLFGKKTPRFNFAYTRQICSIFNVLYGPTLFSYLQDVRLQMSQFDKVQISNACQIATYVPLFYTSIEWSGNEFQSNSYLCVLLRK